MPRKLGDDRRDSPPHNQLIRLIKDIRLRDNNHQQQENNDFPNVV